MTKNIDKSDKYIAFVNYIFGLCERDKGVRARLKRADNPTTEYQSWEVLALFNVRLDFESERLAYALITASVARSSHSANGALLLGQAIAASFDSGASSEQANMRLRRILACDDIEELCRILRPLLSLIQSRVSAPLDHAKLLSDLLWFEHDPQRTKARWAQQFYRFEEDKSLCRGDV